MVYIVNNICAKRQGARPLKGTNMEIKIGRINKQIEEGMGVVLSGDIAVYLSEEMANTLAEQHPTEYLHISEEVANAISKPNFFAYNGDEIEFLSLIKTYGSLFILKVIVGQDRVEKTLKWRVRDITASQNLAGAFTGFGEPIPFKQRKVD